MITVGQQLAGGRETINALPGRSAFPFLRPLVRDLAKKSALGILAAPLIPVVAGHRYIILPSHANDFRIGESGHPARDDVVSAAAQGVAVHFPKEDRLTQGSGALPRFPQIRRPGNLRPLVFIYMRLNQSAQLVELIRRRSRLGRRPCNPRDQGEQSDRHYESWQTLDRVIKHGFSLSRAGGISPLSQDAVTVYM